MTSTRTGKIITALLMVAGLLCTTACEQQGSSDATATPETSYALELLNDLLDQQAELADEIRDATSAGDMASAKELFDQFETMNEEFNRELDTAKEDLTSAELITISKRHRNVVRTLH